MDSFFGYSLDDFKEEARELLNKAEGIIDNIKANPSDPEGINALFRTIHSLKGSAGYVGIPEVNDFAHLYESFLGDLRSSKYEFSDDVLNILVRSRDYLDDLIFNSDSTATVEIDESIEDNMSRIAGALKNRSARSGGLGLDAGGLQVDTTDSIESVDSPYDDSHLGVSSPEEIVFAGGDLEEVKTEAEPEVTSEVTSASEVIAEEASPATEVVIPEPGSANKNIETINEKPIVPPVETPVVEDETIQEPEVPTKATEMSEEEVIRVTIIKSINDLYDSLKTMPVDMEKLERSVARLDDIVSWAFGDDAHSISVPLEEMRVLIDNSEMTEENVANLKKGFNMLVPAIKVQLASLTEGGGDGDRESEEEVTEEAPVKAEEAVKAVESDSRHKAGELTDEAEKLISASRDEIVRITADRDLEEFIKLISEDPVDVESLSTAIERLSDLNKWAFNENENVVDTINTITSLFARSSDPEVIKEIRLRGEALKSALLSLFGEREKEAVEQQPLSQGLDLGGDQPPHRARVQTRGRGGRARAQTQAGRSMKVSSDDLEDLINTVSKLKGVNQRDFEALQQSTLQLRMVPVGEIFSRFRKITRDLSEDLGKDIAIEITGEEVRLDKVLADKLNEPLLHLVRNAASHGIESNEERAAAGKGPAIIGINAFQEGGSIIIEITDNGGGIDVEKVRDKGVKLGLVSASEVEDMKEKDILELIFAPGFSTKEDADKVSGRGVGMDVVKEIISSMHGSVSMKSKRGVGTNFRLQLPLTLAIIKAMVLSHGGSKIAVPSASIERVATMTENEIHSGAIIDKGKMSLYMQEEGEVIPLVNFTDIFGGERKSDKRCVVLLKSGVDDKVAIVADEALGRQSLTVKPLDGFSETPYFSSASVVDDDIVLILNVPSLMSA